MQSKARANWNPPVSFVVLGGVIMVVGALLPWLGRIGEGISNGPANISGWLMVIAGIVAVVAMLVVAIDGYGPARWLSLLAGAVGVVVAVYEAFIKNNLQVGFGIWVALTGSIIVIAGSAIWRAPAIGSAGLAGSAARQLAATLVEPASPVAALAPAPAPDGPYGPGSAAPLADGSAPSGAFTIKGRADSMLYHPSDSPYYGRTRAEAWFATAADAERAGFKRWDHERSA